MRWLLVAALVTTSGVYVAPLGTEEGDALVSPAKMVGLGVVPLAVLAAVVLVLSIPVRFPGVLLLVPGLATASALWSIDLRETVLNALWLWGVTLVGVLVGQYLGVGEILRLTAWTLAGLVGMSAVVSVVAPEWGAPWGAWQGVFEQKNILARIAVLCAIALLLLAWDARGGRRLALSVAAILAAAVVLPAQSATALLVLLGFVVALPVVRALVATPPPLLLPILVVLGTLAYLLAVRLVAAAPVLATAVGRDPTLTGRQGLWEAVLYYAADRPWFGYGYAAFWRGDVGPSGEVARIAGFPAGHAHNGPLDMALQLGVVGVAALFVTLFAFGVAAFRFARSDPSPLALFPLAVVMYLVAYDITENTTTQMMSWLLISMLFTAMRPGPSRA